MEKVTITKARLSNLDQIYKAVCDLEEKTINKESFTQVFSKNITNPQIYYFVAIVNGKVVGFISLYIQYLLHHGGKVAEIQELFVDKTHRRQGIGKELMNKVKEIAKTEKAKLLEVTCSMKRNKTHQFYIKEYLIKTHYKFTENL